MVESRLTDLVSKNQVTEGKVLNIEDKLQQIDEGVNAFKSEIARMAVQISQIHDLVYHSFNRVDLEEGNGKEIIGSTPAGTSNPLGPPRQRGYQPPATKVFTKESLHQNQKRPEAIPIQILTPAEMVARREKGLCYLCDEVYKFRHQCTSRQIFMLEEEEESNEEEEEENTEIVVDSGGKLIEVPDQKDSANKVISGSDLESPIIPLPYSNPITPPPDFSPNQNLPILSYPNPNSSPIQTQSTRAINQNATAFLDVNRPNPWKNKLPKLAYFIRPKPWPDEPPKHIEHNLRSSSEETRKLTHCEDEDEASNGGEVSPDSKQQQKKSVGQIRLFLVTDQAQILAQPVPHSSVLFLLLYDFQNLKDGKIPPNHFQKIKNRIIQLMVSQVADSTWDQFQHRRVSSSSRAAAGIEANKLLLVSHHISRTTATPYTMLSSPTEILGLTISSNKRCPLVQVSHLFDPFETGEIASDLAGERLCSDTDPTPKPRHGSAPERVDCELTPFLDLKWAWSTNKVHRSVDFRNEVANWKDYGEEMEFSEKDLVKKKNDLELSKKKKNSVLVCLKKKKIWDLWAIEDLGDWFIEEDEQLGISELGFQKIGDF